MPSASSVSRTRFRHSTRSASSGRLLPVSRWFAVGASARASLSSAFRNLSIAPEGTALGSMSAHCCAHIWVSTVLSALFRDAHSWRYSDLAWGTSGNIRAASALACLE
eukprot:CAMPEP_0182595050 /NCGR_PEP_ID=MMETSP1324-20130603/81458_1 /TAXON_ID=236786 /ORGANISM="Florenciella sp., Strain RCC1587" /LENGTH=107 /DNA_ID=CAMNT_0024812635 /DNA_START=116 /DNA_END=436 /DNA_ORIENTATION=+